MDIFDLGSTGTICLVLLLLALFGFFKGFIRLLLATLCLVVACYAAYWTHGHALEFINLPASKSPTWLPWLVNIVSGLIAYSICHYLCNFIIDPFNTSKTGRRIGFGMPAALIALCIGVISLCLLLSAIRYAGSVAELEQFQRSIDSDHVQSSEPLSIKQFSIPLLIKAKHIVDTSTYGAWHLQKDPFYNPGKITLCKILILYHHTPSRVKMLKDPELGPLLNHSTFLKIAYQKEAKHVITSRRAIILYSSQSVTEALADKDFLNLISNLDTSTLIIEAS